MHPIDMLYQEHLARRQLPSRRLLEQHTCRITDERVARAIGGRLACALPSAEALDYLRGHLRAPLLTVAAGIGFWAHCLHQVEGVETLATDLFAPEDNPRFRRSGWYPVQRMDARLEVQAGGLHRPLGPGGAGLSNRADPHLACVKATSQ
jgi:hypothetical protein